MNQMNYVTRNAISHNKMKLHFTAFNHAQKHKSQLLFIKGKIRYSFLDTKFWTSHFMHVIYTSSIPLAHITVNYIFYQHFWITENTFCRLNEGVPLTKWNWLLSLCVWNTLWCNSILSWNTAFCVMQFKPCMKLVRLHLVPHSDCVKLDSSFEFSLDRQITCIALV